MSRTLVLPSVAALILAFAGAAQNPAPKSAFDKATLEAYARHLWAVGSDLNITVMDPVASTELPGFKEVAIRVSQGTSGQDLKLLVSSDGQRIIQGSVYNINFNPFKPQLDKIKTEGQPSIGTPGATVVIVDFSDMECPVCKTEAKMLREHLVQEYPTQVRLYFRDFPLDQIHPWARAAAIAGKCVFRQDPKAFWDYHDWIYEHQESITAANLKEQVLGWAKERKDIDSLQFSRCIDTKATEKDVDAGVAAGRALEVDGTPTLFVNGRKVGPTDWPTLKRVIDAEIRYQAVAKDAGEDCGCEVKLDAPGLPPKTPSIPLIKKN